MLVFSNGFNLQIHLYTFERPRFQKFNKILDLLIAMAYSNDCLLYNYLHATTLSFIFNNNLTSFACTNNRPHNKSSSKNNHLRYKTFKSKKIKGTSQTNKRDCKNFLMIFLKVLSLFKYSFIHCIVCYRWIAIFI